MWFLFLLIQRLLHLTEQRECPLLRELFVKLGKLSVMCLDFQQASKLVLALQKNSDYHFLSLFIYVYRFYLARVC